MPSPTRQRLARATSTKRGFAHTVLLRMAADDSRAQRIAEARRERHIKWKVVADFVGVEQRSAQLWAQTGEISWDNCRRLAELFEVDAYWLMNGVERSPTPDPFPPANDEQLDRIEDALARLAEHVQPNVEGQLASVLERINNQLAEQTQVLEDIKGLLGRDTKTADRLEAATETLGGTAAQLDAQIQEIVRDLESASRPRTPKARKTAPKRTHPA